MEYGLIARPPTQESTTQKNADRYASLKGDSNLQSRFYNSNSEYMYYD